MTIEIKRKEGENINNLLYRFNRKIQQSGVLKEVRNRRFKDRNINKNKRRASAIYKSRKTQEIAKMRKLGLMP
ncbi:MAG: small ribosomal subunit protein bS21 [Minisyncoccia bacterium]